MFQKLKTLQRKEVEKRLVLESNEWQEMYSSNYLLYTLAPALGFDQRGIPHSTNSVCAGHTGNYSVAVL